MFDFIIEWVTEDFAIISGYFGFDSEELAELIEELAADVFFW